MKKIALIILLVLGLTLIPGQSYAQDDLADSSNAITQFLSSAIGIKGPLIVVIGKASPNVELWSFFRSFVNYVVVIFLIFIAFAQVTRFNIDQYSIKKTLPNLILGVIMANLSLFICELILNFAESIVTTLNQLGLTGEGAIEGIFSNFGTLIASITAAAIPIATISLPWSLLVGAIAIFIILLFPVVVQLVFLIMFVVRYLIIQFLVVVAPLAFISLATPFTQGLFKAWWKQFSLWTFMKPIGWSLLALGGLIFQTHLGGDLVSFIAGMMAMVAAIVIPFRSGGAINSGLARVAGFLGGGIRTSLANFSQGESTGRGAKIGNFLRRAAGGVTAASYAPGKYKEIMEQSKSRAAAIGKAEAGAKFFGRPSDLEALQDTQIKEYEGEIGDDETETLLTDRLRNSSNAFERAAIVKKAYKNRLNHKFFAEVMRDEKLKKEYGLEGLENDAQGRAIARVRIMGGKVDSAGNVSGDMAKRQNRVLANIAKSNGFKHETVALDGDKIKTKDKIDKDAADYFAGSPLEQAKANRDDWLDTRIDAKGKAIVVGIKEGALNAFRKGVLNGLIENDNALQNFDADVGANLANMTDAEKILLDQLTSAGLDDTKAKKFVEQIMKYKSSGS